MLNITFNSFNVISGPALSLLRSLSEVSPHSHEPSSCVKEVISQPSAGSRGRPATSSLVSSHKES